MLIAFLMPCSGKVGGRKHWQIQLFRLFEGDNLPINADIEYSREKALVIGH